MQHDPTTARSIALAGALKMQTQLAEGAYLVDRTGEAQYRVIKTATGNAYTVDLFINPENRAEYIGLCTCPFCDHARQNVTCKHIEFCYDLESYMTTYADDTEDARAALSRHQEEAREALAIAQGEAAHAAEQEARGWIAAADAHRFYPEFAL